MVVIQNKPNVLLHIVGLCKRLGYASMTSQIRMSLGVWDREGFGRGELFCVMRGRIEYWERVGSRRREEINIGMGDM